MGRFNGRGGGKFFGRGGFGRPDSGGRRDDRGGRGGFDRGSRGDREIFKTVCSNCGKDCEIPFKPRNDKPVYCDDCFAKTKGRDGGRNDRPRFGDRRPQGGVNNGLLESINKKLDRILILLEPSKLQEPAKVEEVKEVAPVVKEEAKEVKPKAKKATSKAKKAKGEVIEEVVAPVETPSEE